MRWKYFLTVCSVILVGHVVTPKWHDDAQAASGPRIEARTDGISVAFLLAGAPPGTVLQVSVKGPEGELVFESRQPSPRIEWLPEAGAREGRYRWEAYAVLPAFLSLPGRDEEDTRRSLESRASPGKTLTGGVISLENGVLTAEQRPAQRHLQKRSSGDGETYVSSSGTKSQTINDFVTIVGTNPQLRYEDTDTGNWEWFVEGDSSDFRITDPVESLFQIDPVAAEFSLVIDAASVNGNARVGIGTTTPIRDIEIQSTPPSLLFDESDSGVKYQLGLRDGTLRYQSIDTLDIPMRIEDGAPQNAFYVENTGDIGFGTSSPTAALHIADPAPEMSLHDTDDSQSWILRNHDIEGSNFQIFDPGTVTRPFQIQPGAPNNMLYLESSGQVGIGTDNPRLALHITSDTNDGLQIENTGASQRWSIFNAGDLRFIDEATDLSPLRLSQGAPQDSLFIASDGNIGIGTNTPSVNLDVTATVPSLRLSGQSRHWTLVNSGSFMLFDDTGATIPVLIEAGAPSNSLRIDPSGRLGLGVNTPEQALHLAADSPAIILDDAGNAKKWYLSNNLGNFTIRDEANTAFVINDGAPNNAIWVATDGSVGLGTAVPTAALHLARSDGGASALIEDTSGSTATRQLLTLSNNGPVELGLINSAGTNWRLSTENDGFAVRKGSGVTKLAVRSNGDLEAAGTLTEGSSITIKDNIVPVSGATVLSKLDVLPLSEWNYIGDPTDRHLGPMAEDFYATFGLGPDDKHIAPKDLAGVALVAAKALRSEVTALREENERLKQRIEDVDSLEDRVRRLEAMIGKHAAGEPTLN